MSVDKRHVLLMFPTSCTLKILLTFCVHTSRKSATSKYIGLHETSFARDSFCKKLCVRISIIKLNRQNLTTIKINQATSSGLTWPQSASTLSNAPSNISTVPGIFPILSSPNKPIRNVFKFSGSSILHGTPIAI